MSSISQSICGLYLSKLGKQAVASSFSTKCRKVSKAEHLLLNVPWRCLCSRKSLEAPAHCELLNLVSTSSVSPGSTRGSSKSFTTNCMSGKYCTILHNEACSNLACLLEYPKVEIVQARPPDVEIWDGLHAGGRVSQVAGFCTNCAGIRVVPIN